MPRGLAQLAAKSKVISVAAIVVVVADGATNGGFLLNNWPARKVVRILGFDRLGAARCRVAKRELRHTFRVLPEGAGNARDKSQVIDLPCYVSRRSSRLC